jgi:type I restriction enzyme, S subunit
MSPELLLKYFDRISKAPDALTRLRSFVLDLAVRGKLVEQDSNDEPASELLRRIQTEKMQLIKDRKIAKQDPVTQISDEELPFFPPSGWGWARLASISRRIHYGFTASANPSLKDVRLLRITDIQNNLVDWPSVPGCEISEREVDQYRLQPGDILIARTGGTIGKTFLVSQISVTAVFASYLIRVQPSSEFYDRYLKLFLESPVYWKQLQEGSRGGGQPNVNGQTLGKMTIAVPPLPEQHRIVAKVDELMALCDRLGAVRAERENRRDRLAGASLHQLNSAADTEALHKHARFYINHLSRLTARSAHIPHLRQTLLNLAVQGKLVPQDANNEPASELLKRVLAEKARLMNEGAIKKQKPLSPVQESSAPFSLPSGWSWARLGDLSRLVTSGSRDWAKFYSSDGAIFIRMGNLSRDSYHLRLNNIQRVKPPTDSEGARTRLEEGDILISITGEVGLLGLIPHNFGESYINQHTCLVRPMDQLRSRYLPELFRSPFAQNQFDEPQRGLKNSFRLTDVTHFLVPLPPLAEQSRIIVKIDELMAVCHRLERQLASVDVQSSEMLEAVLYHALMTPQVVSNIASPTWNAQAHA